MGATPLSLARPNDDTAAGELVITYRTADLDQAIDPARIAAGDVGALTGREVLTARA
ncbi:hypothetical protein [Actinomyces haliotis]|uniref:hypothetical protein n=1 Tax=Actinomyces haliotis TaxID=1280843 RepID=UPI00188FA7AF|nr:hypothetical protein [Actinomyces haliotis]